MTKRRFKIQRQLGIELPGFGNKKAKGPLSKRPTPPGFHGQRRRKYSEYGLRLREKQKIRFHYGIKEKQLQNYISKAKKKSSNWFIILTQLLETRLDNVVFRLGFASSMASARQMVRHGKVLVNGKRVNIPSYQVVLSSKISLKDKVYENVEFQSVRKDPTLELPHFLNIEEKDNKESGELIKLPESGDIPFELNSQFIIEFYGKVK